MEDIKYGATEIEALATFLKLTTQENVDKIDNRNYGIWEYEGEEYLVTHDSELNDKCQQEAQNYYERKIEPHIPQHIKYYFDEDRYIQDKTIEYLKDPAEWLAHYDQEEHEVTIKKRGIEHKYLIYRR